MLAGRGTGASLSMRLKVGHWFCDSFKRFVADSGASIEACSVNRVLVKQTRSSMENP